MLNAGSRGIRPAICPALWSIALILALSQSGSGQCVPIALHGHDTAAGDWFGTSVAIDGGRVIVGASRHEHDGVRSGAAYVFQRSDTGEWIEQAKLLAPQPIAEDTFGAAVAIHGDIAVVGAPGDSVAGFNAGAVHVFRFHPAVGWQHEARLDAFPADSDIAFGRTLAVSGNAIVVGMIKFTDEPGRAFVFRHDHASATWTQETVLVPSDSQNGDLFGAQVDIDGSRIIVGAFEHGKGEQWSGAAYIFHFSTDVGWIQEAQLFSRFATPDVVHPDVIDEYGFGASVSLSGDLACIGAGTSGAGEEKPYGLRVYLFRFDPRRSSWEIEARLKSPLISSSISINRWVAVDGSIAVTGDTFPYNNSSFGAAHIWRTAGTSARWGMAADLRSQSRTSVSQSDFGRVAAVHEQQVVIGDRWSISDTEIGAAFVYDTACFVAGDTNQDQTVDSSDLSAVITGWGDCSWPIDPRTCPGDINHNGTVDIDDLVLVITNWQCIARGNRGQK